jgi:hypothetical protein
MLDATRRYSLEGPKGKGVLSFVPPSQGEWYTYAPSTMERLGSISLTGPEGGGNFSLGFDEFSDRLHLDYRQKVKRFLLSQDVKAYKNETTHKMVDGVSVERYRGGTLSFSGIKCIAVGSFKPRKVVPNVFMESIKINCPIVVDGEVKKIYMIKSVTYRREQKSIDDARHDRKTIMNDYSLEGLFPHGIKSMVESIKVLGNKVSQSYEDVADQSIFDAPQRASTGETMVDFKARMEREGTPVAPF